MKLHQRWIMFRVRKRVHMFILLIQFHTCLCLGNFVFQIQRNSLKVVLYDTYTHTLSQPDVDVLNGNVIQCVELFTNHTRMSMSVIVTDMQHE